MTEGSTKLNEKESHTDSTKYSWRSRVMHNSHCLRTPLLSILSLLPNQEFLQDTGESGVTARTPLTLKSGRRHTEHKADVHGKYSPVAH